MLHRTGYGIQFHIEGIRYIGLDNESNLGIKKIPYTFVSSILRIFSFSIDESDSKIIP